MPVRGLHEEGADPDEEEQREDLQDDDDVVEASRLLHPPHEKPRDGGGDEHREEVEDDGHAEECRVLEVGLVGDRALRAQRARAPLRGEPCGEDRRAVVGGHPGRDLETQTQEQLAEVGGPGDRDGDVADRVLQDQVPADDPGHRLAQGGVAVRVGGAGDRHQARELRVAQRAEAAGDRGEEDRQHHPGAGGRAARARRRAAQGGEDAGPDDRPDPEGREVPAVQGLLEAVLLVTALGDEGIERFPPEEGHGRGLLAGRRVSRQAYEPPTSLANNARHVSGQPRGAPFGLRLTAQGVRRGSASSRSTRGFWSASSRCR